MTKQKTFGVSRGFKIKQEKWKLEKVKKNMSSYESVQWGIENKKNLGKQTSAPKHLWGGGSIELNAVGYFRCYWVDEGTWNRNNHRLIVKIPGDTRVKTRKERLEETIVMRVGRCFQRGDWVLTLGSGKASSLCLHRASPAYLISALQTSTTDIYVDNRRLGSSLLSSERW